MDDGWIGEQVNGWMMDRQINRWMDGQMNEQVDGWKDGWMTDGWIDE